MRKNAELIAVGTELLLGDIQNTHAQFLSRQLAALGINVLYHSAVGDNYERLRRQTELALSRSDILIFTGGLGPTDDDLTKEVVCDVLGVPLLENRQILDDIEAYFRRTGREMPESNRKQAMVPPDAVVMPNPYGTAPGLIIDDGVHCVILLPGPPRELHPMFAEQALPYLSRYAEGEICSHTLRVFGIGESAIQQALKHLLDQENPTTALYAKDGEVQIRVTAAAPNQSMADLCIKPVLDDIRRILGDAVYGQDVDSLEEVVVGMLRAKRQRIALAESCTGGMLASKITSIPGASEIFDCGIVSYSNEVKATELFVSEKTLKQYGAVSEQVAIQMAYGARRKGHASIGVGITGIAGPDGGTPEKPVGTVYVAVNTKETTLVKHLQLGHGQANERDYIRTVSCMHALDMVRRVLMKTEEADRAVKDYFAQEKQERKAHHRMIFKRFIPWKGDSAGEVVRKLILLVALSVFIVSAVYIGQYVYDNVAQQRLLGRLQTMIDAPPTAQELSGLPEGYLPEFAKLYQINPEIKGYLSIDGTDIALPVVQSTDNDKYLNTSFDGSFNRNGTPFADYRNNISPDSADFNTVIYGHNIIGGLMFSPLKEYTSLSYFKEHPLINYNTVYEKGQWKVFACMIIDGSMSDSDPFYYHDFLRFTDELDFEIYMDEVNRRTLYHTGVDVNSSDKIITLSTCTSDSTLKDGRCVILARKVRTGESAVVDVNAATVNGNVRYPDTYYTQHRQTNPFLNGN